LGYTLPTYISSKAITFPGLRIGDNSFVMEANVIQPFASVGSDTIVWSGGHIGHHSTVGDHCFLARSIISGNVQVGDHSYLGGDCIIRDGVTVAPRNLIGMRAYVGKDTKPDEVYQGQVSEASRVPSYRIPL
jgi:UDP-3-O-[3-hydroxymyristoyl] glucosamine N-acyltransferase